VSEPLTQRPIEVDAKRLSDELEALAQISDMPAPAVTRIVFTPTDMRARALLIEKCEEAGLSVRYDAVGNTFARWAGTDATAPAIGTGSHIDAIPNAGRFDGTVGVFGGLEAIRALQRSGVRPKHSIELLLFTSEEPTRFGLGCLGSRLLSGTLTPAAARKLRDKDGQSVDAARTAAGFTGKLESVKLPLGYYKAFIELHIEQGPILEDKKIPIGIVTKIAAPAAASIAIEGSGGHAGAVLMRARRDALCAAAELILAIENAARGSKSPDNVATVGTIEAFPGAVNSIPSRVKFSLDTRDTDLACRDATMRAVDDATKRVAQQRSVKVSFEPLNADDPADCSDEVISAVEAACAKHGIPSEKMISRAYHDSLFMSHVAPIGMIFIPCFKGHSHRPDEYASPEAIARGALVLAEALATLAS
jgi:ureidoglycolate amidohydrolase